MYENDKNAVVDKNYVMCFRRAIPAEEPLYDNFWTEPNSRDSFYGLSSEQPRGEPIRLHSVIKVTSLGELERHGIVYTNRVSTDGEIAIDPNKKFEGVLFQYKDFGEQCDLLRYLEEGGKTREELLRESQKNYYRRSKSQGLPIKLSSVVIAALRERIIERNIYEAEAIERGYNTREKEGGEIDGK